VDVKLDGPALRLTIFMSEDDSYHHKPLYHEIVRRAHAAGLAGATVLHGAEGFGVSSRLHTNRLLSLYEDLPATVIIIDSEERIRAFLPQLDDLTDAQLAILDPVDIIRYVGSATATPPPDHAPGVAATTGEG
jgi:PII-like signaling protein